jgi:hypothetical protein
VMVPIHPEEKKKATICIPRMFCSNLSTNSQFVSIWEYKALIHYCDLCESKFMSRKFRRLGVEEARVGQQEVEVDGQ